MQNSLSVFGALAILLAAALFCAMSIVALGPWLARYAVAKPNARSSHKTPTPQGGGIAVIGTTVAIAGGVLFMFGQANTKVGPLLVIFAAVLLIAGVGVLADKRPIAPAPRLVVQTFAVAAVLSALPPELRVIPVLPWWSERILLLLGTLWFVNLVNFMDGIDWLTVAEVVPITATIAAIGFFGALPPAAILVSLALCGAIIGFAYFNRPVATLFLGDVGSLPIGLLLGWLLIVLAGNGGRAAAILLPLYYLADTTITLVRRVANCEPVWQAHRSHFYQRATDRGFTVMQIVARVFVINVALAALALTTIVLPSQTTQVSALCGGAALVVWLLAVFARGPLR